MRTKMKKLTVTVAAGLLLTLTASPALAFEPPSDPADVFGCPDVTGHPGATGQQRAMATGNTFAAWNAHFNSEQIGSCAD